MPHVRVSSITLQAISNAASRFEIHVLDDRNTVYHKDGSADIPLSQLTINFLEKYRFDGETMDDTICRLCRGGLS